MNFKYGTALFAVLALSTVAEAAAQVVRGRIVDANTGSAVSGAQVTVSGQQGGVATSQDGSFTIDAPASSELVVSALGYKPAVFVPSAGSPILIKLEQASSDTVIVTGFRLGQARALTEQRSATNTVSIQSADEAGKFPDNNVAEALSRLPGITLVRDQQTGEGQLVTIRGLDSGLNVFTVNGVRLAQTQSDRQIALDTLPTDGFQQLRVSKTSTPDMDGDAIGGTVDLRLPSAFDYSDLRYGLTYEGSYQDRGAGWGQKWTGNVSNVFGERDEFGALLSFYVGDRDTISEESENEGEWEPYAWRKNAQVAIDERSLLLPGVGLDLWENNIERFGGVLSLDWRPTDEVKAYIRGQYGEYTKDTQNNGLVVRSLDTTGRLTQVNEGDTSLAQPSQSIASVAANGVITYRYTPAQIVDRNGDGVITSADATTNSYWSLVGGSGVYDPRRSRVDRYFNDTITGKTQGLVQIGGEYDGDALRITGDLSYSGGKESSESLGVTYRAAGATTPPAGQTATFDDFFLTNGVTFSIPDERFPLWLMPGSSYGLVYNLDAFAYSGASASTNIVEDEKTSARLDGIYRLDGDFFESLGAGAKLVRSERRRDRENVLSAVSSEVTSAGGATLALANTRGLVGAEYGDFFDGVYSGNRRFGRVFATEGVRSFFGDLTQGRTFTSAQQNQDDYEGTEDVLSVYGLANIQYGNWDGVAGVRFEQTSIDNTFWRTDSANSGFVSQDSDYSNVLPSLHINYRFNPNMLVRGAVWTSISRPEFQYVSGRETFSRDAAGVVTSISRGNPDLKPAESTNFDLGFEWYNEDVGLFQAAVYRKEIDNFIFLNNAITASTLNPDGVNISQPLNGASAELYGLEIGLQQQLRDLASPFDGLGFIANLTLQDSEADTGEAYRNGEPIPFINAPGAQGNLSLYYEKYGVQARLSYNYSAAYIEDTRDNAIDKWIQPWDRVDFMARYEMENGFSVTFEAQNLFDSHAYFATKGESRAYQKDYVESGRSFFLTLGWQN